MKREEMENKKGKERNKRARRIYEEGGPRRVGGGERTIDNLVGYICYSSRTIKWSTQNRQRGNTLAETKE